MEVLIDLDDWIEQEKERLEEFKNLCLTQAKVIQSKEAWAEEYLNYINQSKTI